MSRAIINPPTSGREENRRPWHAWSPVVVLPIVLWAYWPALIGLVQRWLHDARYSHGFLVPFLAALIWWVHHRSYPLRECEPSWWGMPVLLGGAVLRLVGAYYYLDFFDGLSLLPSLLGLLLLIGGWPLARQTAPAIGVLIFLLPLPYQLEGTLSAPLQWIGTVANTFALQTLGLPAVSEGTIIRIDDRHRRVARRYAGHHRRP